MGSYYQLSKSHYLAATRDRVIGKTAYGFGIRVENLREARFLVFLLLHFAPFFLKLLFPNMFSSNHHQLLPCKLEYFMDFHISKQ